MIEPENCVGLPSFRMKWIKRIFLALGMVLVVLAVLAGVASHRAHTLPAWYRAQRSTPAQRQAAVQHVQQVLGDTFSWSADMQAQAVRARTQGWDASAATAKTITLSEDEINSFYDAHDDTATAAVAERVNQFMSGFRITLIDGAIVMSGTPKDSEALVSFVLKPKVDDQAHLDLQLTDVMAGILSVPRAALGGTFDKLQVVLAAHVADEQPKAKVDAYGVVNRAEVTAAYSQILLDCLAEQSSDATLFVPFDAKDLSRALAVRLTDIKAGDGVLTLTLRPLTPPERLALSQKINVAASPTTPTR